MKLLSLQIYPRGNNGLQSDKLFFANHITQLYGANGSGKSPLIKTIAFCLGYPSKFRDEIYEKCNYAVLEVEIEKRIYKFQRNYEKNNFLITVTNPYQKSEDFFSEQSFSEFIFTLFNLPFENLVSSKRVLIQPFISCLLPIFYLDQDKGYSKIYAPDSSFIQDQFAEVLRILLGIPTKNSFDAKKSQIEAKNYLEEMDRKIVEHRQRIEFEKSNLSQILRNTNEIKNEIDIYQNEYRILQESGNSKDESIHAVQLLIYSKERQLAEVKQKIHEISTKQFNINQIINEIETEINTLNLNEEARRAFLIFEEICGAGSCQLFAKSSQIYSKNLLYLKDQIKDLRHDYNTSTLHLLDLDNEQDEIIKGIAEQKAKVEKLKSESEITTLIEAMSEVKNKIFLLQNELFEIERVENLEAKHIEYINTRNKAREKYESYSKSNSSTPTLIRARLDLKELYSKWLQILKTPNIKGEVIIDNDFNPKLGIETIPQLSGSTLTRAVLAYHASIIELMCQMKCLKFNFLIMDTPRQHELQDIDLLSFIFELKELCKLYNLQIIFSNTSFTYEGDINDTKWTPQYDGLEQKMFLF